VAARLRPQAIITTERSVPWPPAAVCAYLVGGIGPSRKMPALGLPRGRSTIVGAATNGRRRDRRHGQPGCRADRMPPGATTKAPHGALAPISGALTEFPLDTTVRH
jgi:hypothetical protein